MRFSDSNPPLIGSEVWFIEEDYRTNRSIVRSGLVFAKMLRYGMGPLIIVDIVSATTEDMSQRLYHYQECNDDDNDDTKRCSPEALFDSAEAAGKSVIINKGESK